VNPITLSWLSIPCESIKRRALLLLRKRLVVLGTSQPATIDPEVISNSLLVELARASSPNGGRLVLATYLNGARKNGEADCDHLRLFVVDVASRRVLRSAEVLPGPFANFHNPMSPQPSLSFVSPTRVFLDGASTLIPNGVFDTGTAAFQRTESDVSPMGHFMTNRAGNVLVDLATMKQYSLQLDKASWDAARRSAPSCER
jgi:hypothetical protein